jgi:hypothetical protein
MFPKEKKDSLAAGLLFLRFQPTGAGDASHHYALWGFPHAAFQLALVIGRIEVALRLGD